jgi:hypothetical protein
MTFEEMKKRGRELAEYLQNDPSVKLVAALPQADAADDWIMCTWPAGSGVSALTVEEDAVLRQLYESHVAAVCAGGRLPWYDCETKRAVFFVAVPKDASVVPLPVRVPVEQRGGLAVAALVGELRALSDACRALSVRLDTFARGFEKGQEGDV